MHEINQKFKIINHGQILNRSQQKSTRQYIKQKNLNNRDSDSK